MCRNQRRLLTVLTVLSIFFFSYTMVFADTPPSPNPSARLLDGNGNKITSTSGSTVRALDVHLDSAVSATLSSSIGSPLYTSTIFSNTIIDPRDRSWSLSQGSDSVLAYQGGTWSFSLPSGASTLAAQNTSNSYLSSIDTKLTGPFPITAIALPLPSGAAQDSTVFNLLSPLNLINSKIPTQGQKAKSQSIPVVLASDSDPVVVSGTFAFSDPSNNAVNTPDPAIVKVVAGSDGIRSRIIKTKTDGTILTEISSGAITVLNPVTNVMVTGTVSANILSSVLPSGAATSVLQTQSNVSLSSIDSKLSSPIPVAGSVSILGVPTVQVSGTQIVSGVVQIGNLPSVQTVVVSGPIQVSTLPPVTLSGTSPVSIASSITLPVSAIGIVQVAGAVSASVVFPAQQIVVTSGTTQISGQVSATILNPVTSVSATILNPVTSVSATITNLPAIQVVSATQALPVSISNPLPLPVSATGTTSVQGAVSILGTVITSGVISVNNIVSTSSTGITQVSGNVNTTVSGTVPVSIAGTVITSGTINNFPTDQLIHGLVSATILNPVTSVSATILGIVPVSATGITSVLVTNSNLSVTTSGTSIVSVTSSALPTGAATSANQTSELANQTLLQATASSTALSVSGTNTRLDTVNTNLGTINTSIGSTNTLIGTTNSISTSNGVNAVSASSINHTDILNLTGSVSANTVVAQSVQSSVSGTNTRLDTANTNLGTINSSILATNSLVTSGNSLTTINGTNAVSASSIAHTDSLSLSALVTTNNTSTISAATSLASIDSKTPALDQLLSSGNITVIDTGSTTGTQYASQTVVTGTPTTGSVVSAIINSVNTVMVVITGTWTGTLGIEVSSDGGTNFETRGIHVVGTNIFSGSITANVTGSMNASAKTNVRVRATSAITGTAVVKFLISDNLSNVYIANSIKIIDSASQLNPVGLNIVSGNVLPTVSNTAVVVTMRDPVSTKTNAVSGTLFGITLGTSSTQIVAANPNRKGLVFTNTGLGQAFCSDVGLPAVSGTGLVLWTGGSYNMQEYGFTTNAINCTISGTTSVLSGRESQ